MEAKLRQYRARQRRQEFVESTTEKIAKTKRRFTEFLKNMIKINIDEPQVDDTPILKEQVPVKQNIPKKTQLDASYDDKRKLNESLSPNEVDADISEDESSEEKPKETWIYFIFKWSFYTLIWVTLYFYFITLQFGAVFFAISLLIGIYLNTGTRLRKKGEVSAYSVFNENCERIDGTVTAEKLQGEMFYGTFRLF